MTVVAKDAGRRQLKNTLEKDLCGMMKRERNGGCLPPLYKSSRKKVGAKAVRNAKFELDWEKRGSQAFEESMDLCNRWNRLEGRIRGHAQDKKVNNRITKYSMAHERAIVLICHSAFVTAFI